MIPLLLPKVDLKMGICGMIVAHALEGMSFTVRIGVLGRISSLLQKEDRGRLFLWKSLYWDVKSGTPTTTFFWQKLKLEPKCWVLHDKIHQLKELLLELFHFWKFI